MVCKHVTSYFNSLTLIDNYILHKSKYYIYHDDNHLISFNCLTDEKLSFNILKYHCKRLSESNSSKFRNVATCITNSLQLRLLIKTQSGVAER